MQRLNIKLPLLMMIVLTASRCGGLSTTKSERSAEQPTEVAGGFGLACLVVPGASDSSSLGIGCVFEDKDGQKFKDFANIKLDFSVQVAGQTISVAKQGLESEYNYVFSVPSEDVDSVQIEAKFINPEADNIVLSDKSSTLRQALMNGCDLQKFQPSFTSAVAGDSQVILTWKANGDVTPIKGYYIRYWEGHDFSNTPPTPPRGAAGNGVPLGYHPSENQLVSETTTTVSGLQNGKTYTFGVQASEPLRCGYGWETYISATPSAP